MAKLRPEVELPRPRSNGAALVAVASLAMFTAIGASAFLVRMRMERMQQPMVLATPAGLVITDDTAVGDVDDDYGGDLPPVMLGTAPTERPTNTGEQHRQYFRSQVELVAQEAIEGNCDAANARLMHLLDNPLIYSADDLPKTLPPCVHVPSELLPMPAPPPSVEVRFAPVRQR